MATATVSEVRAFLVEYFFEKANYRHSLVEEEVRWGADKNASYAESLARMGRYVESLPDDDPNLLMLANCELLYFEGAGFSLPTDPDGMQTVTDTKAIHCGPRGKPIELADCPEWFAFWVNVVVDEADELSPPEDN